MPRHLPLRVSLTILTASAALAASLALPGCAGGDDAATGGAPDASARVTGPVTVLAAASLTEVFTQLGTDFEAAHPGTTVTFSFAASSTLAQQINAGAPGDVFAAASPTTMATVTDAGNAAGQPQVFARNQLVIAVAQGNPLGISGLADLTGPAVKTAICAEQVPCGAVAQRVLVASGVDLEPATLERDVKAALAKVRLGEADAALVYRTDVAAVSDVTGVEFGESAVARNDYPIVTLRDAGNRAGAEAFIDFVRADQASATLLAAGFQRP
ncbi:MAG: molybdate ABC transporter substrate-binding protein [Dactylosporangium sp.]|nr:molybdate ABC transporter substrate-binding protein [Dactylosporangium sp.]NNJ61977.1 molybdate ABC transporter substrate-binding protein [Dactylosporangium sp.]